MFDVLSCQLLRVTKGEFGTALEKQQTSVLGRFHLMSGTHGGCTLHVS